MVWSLDSVFIYDISPERVMLRIKKAETAAKEKIGEKNFVFSERRSGAGMI